MNIAITGIHTGIGKTVCSAVICQALGFDYWKPVQAGDLEHTDSMFIARHVGHPRSVIHPERYRLKTAASPHYAAALEGTEITREDFVLPVTGNGLVVETAGGLMSPLARNFLNLDLVAHLGLPAVLVSNNYLGSINHTLMSHAALAARDIRVLGIVFVGDQVPASESFILDHTGCTRLFSIPHFTHLDKATLDDFVKTISIEIRP